MTTQPIDLLYGPLYHRLPHGHVPLNSRFTQDVIDMALGGIQPATGRATAPAGQRGRRAAPPGGL